MRGAVFAVVVAAGVADVAGGPPAQAASTAASVTSCRREGKGPGDAMNDIEIQYFAVLRERAGTGRETVQTAAATAADLYDELAARHDFGLPRAMLRVAVNDEFADWTRPLAAGDRVVFIPPVAGG